MSAIYGWVGKILRVDLTSRTITAEDTAKYVPDYIGGKGIATRIAWDELKPVTGPYDADNILIFMSGPLTGTLAPTSGRGIVCGVSARTYPTFWFTYGTMGGDWAAEMKFAGFDGIVIKGIADKPVYLSVHDGNAELKDAHGLWGLDTFCTQRSLKTTHGEQSQVVCIGPAGENLVRWASIQHKLSNAIGDAGLGAVMGVKKLKAIAFRGTGGIRIAKPAEFIRACMLATNLISSGPTFSPIKGPAGRPPAPNTLPCSFGCPLGCGKMLKNMPAGIQIGSGLRNMMAHCEDRVFIYGDVKTNYPPKDIADRYKGDMFTRETKGFGEKSGTELQSLCEGLGLSSAFPLNFYPWFWQCIENGVTELNSYKLDPDNPRFWYDLANKIAYREGIGDILADDLIRAINKLELPDILKKAAHFQFPQWGQPEHRQGRAYESQPSPLWIHTSLHWAIDSRDPMASHHQSSFVSMWFPLHHEGKGGSADVDFRKLMATYAKIFGTAKGMEPGFGHIDEKTKLTFWMDNRAQLKDSLILCDWCFPRILRGFHSREELLAAKDYAGDINAEAKMLAPLTGLKLTTADLEKAGDRIRNLDRALHIRNYDRSREIDSSGEWLCEYPEKSDGTNWDIALFNSILDNYYDKRGWDKKTGRPTRAKLEELGLKDVADELARIGKLPQHA